MGLETTALIHYPHLPKRASHQMQIWPPLYVNPSVGPHCSQGSKEQSFKNATL